MNEARHVMLYGLGGLLGVIAFAVALIVLQLARPEVDWTRHYVSEFANDPLGSWFVFGASVHGLGNLALSVGLRRSLGRGVQSTAGGVFFALAALGILAAGLFPTDPAGQARTLSGLVHRLAAGMSFPLELLALFLFSTCFAASPRWRRRAGLSFAWSALATATLAWLFIAVLWNRMPGAAERLALASFLFWELWAALELLRSCANDAHGASPLGLSNDPAEMLSRRRGVSVKARIGVGGPFPRRGVRQDRFD